MKILLERIFFFQSKGKLKLKIVISATVVLKKQKKVIFISKKVLKTRKRRK